MNGVTPVAFVNVLKAGVNEWNPRADWPESRVARRPSECLGPVLFHNRPCQDVLRHRRTDNFRHGDGLYEPAISSIRQ